MLRIQSRLEISNIFDQKESRFQDSTKTIRDRGIFKCPGLNFDNKDMIEGEYTETHSNSAIVDENSSQMEAKNSILAETNIETESTSQLEVTSAVLIEDSIEIQSKTSPNQTGEICENPTELNTTVLSTKELVYTTPASANTRLLSLSESDALNSDDGPIVPAMSANNVKFETQSVSSTNESGLLEGFINTSQKDELSVENIENTVLDRENRDQIDDRGTENIDDNLMVTESEDVAQEDLGDLPLWVAQLKGCERIGDSYRGYVHTETELDVLLSMHKENTHSSWGTRQSPSSQKPSVRFMWKSQYVPYDGVPFLNSGKLVVHKSRCVRSDCRQVDLIGKCVDVTRLSNNVSEDSSLKVKLSGVRLK